LPGFGVLILGKRNGSIGSETLSALAPLNSKLAQACRSNLAERRLREERNRFEAIFDAIPEPTVNVVVDDGTEYIRRANDAFKRTFGYENSQLRGRNVNSLMITEGESAETTELVAALDREEALTREVTRKTPSGDGHFLFSGIPVTATDTTEYFGVYVDISDQKKREQTLEHLYIAAQDLLDEESRQRVCEQTVQTVESVLGHSIASAHLYNRDTEALTLTAATQRVEESVDDKQVGYTNKDTVVWQAYEQNNSIRIDDTTSFDGTVPDSGIPIQSGIVLPIGPHGVLTTAAPEPDAFDDEDMYFLRLLSQLVEIALNRTANEEGLTTAQRVGRKALHAETHEEMAEFVLDEIPTVLDLPIAGIWKYQPARQVLEPLRQTARSDALLGDQPELPRGESIAWQTFADGSASIVSDVSKRNETYNPDTPIETEVIVPIGEFGIMIAAATRENSFTQLDLDILETVATNLEVTAEIIDNRRDISLLEQVIARVLRHNVRNQLTPIRGYADTIREQADDPIETYAKEIVDSSSELEKVADHAREMRQIIQDRDQMTRLSLADEVRRAAATVEEEFPDGTVVLRVDDEGEVTAHPKLQTAISHLLRNGFEHNKSHSPRVVVTVEARDAGHTVEVTDNGPGIDAYELETLDNHGESTLQHGSGAGLWIVDRVVEYSEGLLEFDTADGTTARITFPETTAA
jgi:PAS domain S-box-containing protein